jgi:hypothetical protein
MKVRLVCEQGMRYWMIQPLVAQPEYIGAVDSGSSSGGCISPDASSLVLGSSEEDGGAACSSSGGSGGSPTSPAGSPRVSVEARPRAPSAPSTIGLAARALQRLIGPRRVDLEVDHSSHLHSATPSTVHVDDEQTKRAHLHRPLSLCVLKLCLQYC